MFILTKYLRKYPEFNICKNSSALAAQWKAKVEVMQLFSVGSTTFLLLEQLLIGST